MILVGEKGLEPSRVYTHSFGISRNIFASTYTKKSLSANSSTPPREKPDLIVRIRHM